jgi:hypothetical protein
MPYPTITPQSSFKAQFGKLRAFTGTSLPADDDHLTVLNPIDDFFAIARNRQLRIVCDEVLGLLPRFKSGSGCINRRTPSLSIDPAALDGHSLYPSPLPAKPMVIVTKQSIGIELLSVSGAHDRSHRVANILAVTIKQNAHNVRTPSSSSMSRRCNSRQNILLNPSSAQALNVNNPTF